MQGGRTAATADSSRGIGQQGKGMMQKPVVPVPIQSTATLLALQFSALPTSQEKQIFYAGAVAHVISEARARCGRGRCRRRWPLGLDKQKPQGPWHLVKSGKANPETDRQIGRPYLKSGKNICLTRPQISKVKKRPLALALLCGPPVIC